MLPPLQTIATLRPANRSGSPSTAARAAAPAGRAALLTRLPQVPRRRSGLALCADVLDRTAEEQVVSPAPCQPVVTSAQFRKVASVAHDMETSV
jgi:hypothetical protein